MTSVKETLGFIKLQHRVNQKELFQGKLKQVNKNERHSVCDKSEKSKEPLLHYHLLIGGIIEQ